MAAGATGRGKDLLARGRSALQLQGGKTGIGRGCGRDRADHSVGDGAYGLPSAAPHHDEREKRGKGSGGYGRASHPAQSNQPQRTECAV